MDLILKKICTVLIFIFITEVTVSRSNETSTNQHYRSGARGRIIKHYSGTRPEPILCAGEDFQPDLHNCAMFYRCIKTGNDKYIQFRFQCGPGTIYDPDKKACNYPQYTRRSDCSGFSPPLINIAHNNEIASIVDNEVPSPMVINNPIYTSNILEKSTTIATKATPSYTLHSNTERSITSATVNYPWVSSIDPDDKAETVKPLDTLANIPHQTFQVDICTSDGFMGDSKNCRKFYRCVSNQRGGYTRYEFSCTETTIWDDINQICNHAWAVKRSSCTHHSDKISHLIPDLNNEKLHIPDESNRKPVSNKDPITVQQQLQIGYGSEVTQTQTQIGNDHVQQIQTQINYGDRLNRNENKTGNKQNQTQVSDGSAISQSQTQIDYGKKGIQTQLQIDHSKDASQNQIQISESSTQKTSTTVSDFDNKEVNKPEAMKCTEADFIGDDNDCRKFYRCVNDGHGGFKKIEFICAEGTAWDSSLKTCNHIWAVKGCNSHKPTVEYIPTIESSSDTITATTLKTTPSSLGTTFTENNYTTPQGNEDYEDTGYGKPKPEYTPAVLSSTTISAVNNLNHTECTANGFLGDANDCKIFYRCVDNGNGGFTKYVFSCSDGTLWDPEIKACNHARAVGKCGSYSSADINKEKETTKASTTLSSISVQSTLPTHLPNELFQDQYDEHNMPGYGPQNDNIQISTSSKRPLIIAQNEHVCRSSGFVGDMNDCKKFYRCVDDGNGSYTKYEFMCGEGTVWDEELKSCNHAWAVTNCGIKEESVNNEISNEFTPNETSNSEVITTTAISVSTETVNQESDGEACVTSGFFGYPAHCDKFYRCVDNSEGGFNRYEYVCSKGTVWDKSLKACNHVWAVEECGAANNATTHMPSESTTESSNILNTSLDHDNDPSSQNTSEDICSKHKTVTVCTQEGFIADPNNCKSFYRCVQDGKGGLTKHQFSCGDGTYWNQEILSCDHNTFNKTCGSEFQHETCIASISPVNDEMIVETTTLSREDNHQQKPILEPPRTPIICTSEGFYGDQHDCKKFYRCVNDGKQGYTLYNFNCGDGTFWDQEILACNHDSYSKCKSVTLGSSQTTENQSQLESIPTTTEKSDIISSSVVRECQSEGFFADPSDCKNFIRCVSNNQGGYTKYEFTCAKGTVWVQEILTCYHDTGEIYCNSQTVAQPVTNKELQHTTETYDLNVGNGNNDVNATNNDCLFEGYYPNKDDCRKFYRCVDDGKGSFLKYEYACSEGTAWDSEILSCNHINQVSSCQALVMHDDDNGQTTQKTDPPPKGSTISTTSTLSSSTTQKPLNNSEDHSHDSNLHKTDSCHSEGYFGDTQNCAKFYRCVSYSNGGYTKYDFTCAEGTVWDKDVVTCNHPQNVVNPSCKQTQSNSTTEKSSDNTSAVSTSETSNGQNESSKIPETNNITCTKAGFYADPRDCKKFYRCVSWDENETKFSIYHFDCAEGTIWDPAIETCNHENSVYPPRDCSHSPSSSTEVTSTTEKESTTRTTTKFTTQSTTKSTSQSTTNSTTPSTTKSTTQSTTKATSALTTTEQTKETTTGESTTEQLEESTTELSETSTTERSGEKTTLQSGENTTEHSPESTTQQSAESTTQNSDENTTEPLVVSTTEQSGESTTQQTAQSTTEQLVESTTEQSGDSTTQQTQESTTEQLVDSTTERSGESTTAQSSESTTQESWDSTTEQYTSSTTDKYEVSTTELSTEITTEQSGDTSTQQYTESTTENSTENTTTEGTTTEQPTTENNEATESETDNSTENPTDRDCPETEEDQYLFACPSSFKRHPKYCNLFYQCDENEDTHDLKIAVFTCPNNTIYDESQIKCVNESKAEKSCDGEISQKRRFKRKDKIGNNYDDPIVVTENSYRCTDSGYFAFEKEGNCSPGFLKCTFTKTKKLRGLVYQCPSGYLFWNVSRRCEPIHKVSDCTHSSQYDWRKRWEIPTERKNVDW